MVIRDMPLSSGVTAPVPHHIAAVASWVRTVGGRPPQRTAWGNDAMFSSACGRRARRRRWNWLNPFPAVRVKDRMGWATPHAG